MNKTKHVFLAASMMLAMVFMLTACGEHSFFDDILSGTSSSSDGGNGGNSSPSGGNSFVDSRDNQTYKTVKIGNQTWMAENLNYAVETSWCYFNEPSYCDTYGRLYDWATAMVLPSSCNSNTCSNQMQTKHRGVCPDGWHLPSRDEWNELINYVATEAPTGGIYKEDAKYLRAKEGWYKCGPSGSGKEFLCEDTYGFTALPGGFAYSGGSFSGVRDFGTWWSAYETLYHSAGYKELYYGSYASTWETLGSGNYGNKTQLHSVRCVKN
jgi:uncharacterized protein (TIGR02145 family)